jgi:hypothetical protein
MKNQHWIGGGIVALIIIFLIFHWSHIADILGVGTEGATKEADLDNCKTLRVKFAFDDYPEVEGKTKTADGARTYKSIVDMMKAFDESSFVRNTYEPRTDTHFSFTIMGDDQTEFLDQIRHKQLAYKLTCAEKLTEKDMFY